MDQPLISVIIPIYNMELYLERCLDSVLKNTYHNIEVICVDDGSKDRSLEILRRYEAADPRIVVIAKENGGVSSARNAGLVRIKGEYVSFVDPDDYVHSQFFELMHRAIKNADSGIAICRFQPFECGQDDLASESYLPDSNYTRESSFLQIFESPDLIFYSCCGKLIRTELLHNLQFREDMRYGEDTIFFSQVCEKDRSKKAILLSYSLYFYYQREGSAVKVAGKIESLKRSSAWIQQLKESDRDDIYLYNALKWSFSNRYIYSHIRIDREAVRECNTQLRGLRRRLLKTNIFRMKKKIAYFLLIDYPVLDWLHRVLREPSLIVWEKMESKKRRQERKE